MTLIVEVDRPFQRRPGIYRSRLMTRVWWGYLAVAWLHVPFAEFCVTPKVWEMEGQPLERRGVLEALRRRNDA